MLEVLAGLAAPERVMTVYSPRRRIAAALVVAAHLVVLLALLRPVGVLPPQAAATLEAVNIAMPPPPAPSPAKHPATTASAPRTPTAAAPAPQAPAPPAPDGVGPSGIPGGTASGGGTGGSGSGGITRARWASGSITNHDYPKAARNAGVGGAVTVHFDVRADGQVENCRVIASSGAALLDETTCRLIEARFRYTPARDAGGNAVGDVAGWRQDWWLGAPR